MKIKTFLFIIGIVIIYIVGFFIYIKYTNYIVGDRTSTYLTSWFTGSGVVYTLSNIGVGTSTPVYGLQVVNGTTTPVIAIGSSNTASTTRGKICLYNGASFSVISFLTNSTSTTISTSTSCQ